MPHKHVHSRLNSSSSRLFFTMLLNFLIFAIEVIGGILSGSLSLISDALHNFSDAIAIIISYIALKLSKLPKTEHYTFGFKRAETLAAIINSATLVAICFYLFKEAYDRFVKPEPIAGGMMVIVATVGLTANILGTLLLKKDAKGNMNIRSVYLHLFSDAVSSVAVIIGGIFIHFLRIYWVDPLLTVLISIYILKKSFEIVKDATNVLMMGTPEMISLKDIKKKIEAIPSVKNIHHVHLWRLNDKNLHFEAHVEVEDMLITDSTKLINHIEEKLKKLYHINHVTLQLESDKCKSKKLVNF
ncbi:MAG: cation transporter [Deltaproteobacteria bacterium]|nr:cation transporter [Deltaproteobacteria bacterium]